ncbi:hypothetical protein [Desulfurobacterium atlanticum]|uniref:Uncharacterized protein n=1 Tax=Desulfurobacterium atlanticum TaxID=240169 RepID=A0A238ZIY1_9BACT|nr:hypothetical protein [Desulfurobacterium atlanticum]SNR83210.1 hypothetical protein SAMN06265340_10911 [Desulfurobacterium atlanticum]
MEMENTGVVDLQPAIQAFEELRGEIGRLGIWRNGSYLGKHLPEEVSGDIIEWIKETYGGGRYQVVLYGTDGKVKKRLSFSVAGEPKEPGEKKEGSDGTIELLRELIEKLEDRKSGGTDTVALFQMMLQMQQQQFQLLLQTLKGEKRESSFIDKFVDKVLSNPAVLMSAGGAVWKLLQKAISSKNELLELIRVAKDDPELKELAVQAVGAKYGGAGGLIDKVLSNPELLNKTLEIVNKALSVKAAGRNPVPVIKKEIRKLSPSVDKPVEKSTNMGEVVNNGQNGIGIQEIVAVGTRILQMAESGRSAVEIWNSLSDEEIDIFVTLVDGYGMKTADDMVKVLEGLPVPRFTIAGYIEAINRHKQVVNELISFCVMDEVQEGIQENAQAEIEGISGQDKRNTTGETSGESQE